MEARSREKKTKHGCKYGEGESSKKGDAAKSKGSATATTTKKGEVGEIPGLASLNNFKELNRKGVGSARGD